MKPVIGITPAPSRDVRPHGTFDRFAMAANYVEAVAAAGGIPVVLAPHEDPSPQLLDMLHGILLSGGADIDPVLFGESERHPKTYEVNALRDEFELWLLAEADQRDLPVLGICRGIQVMNVGFGGTLYQHVPDQFEGAGEHRQQEDGIEATEPSHTVSLAPNGTLERIYGTTKTDTNSFHHQAINDLAPPLVAEGWAPDGLVEAVVHPGKSFMVGVQWHPEIMFLAHPDQCAPFNALVAAATARLMVPAGD